MKLELKHLAAYLPYGLQVTSDRGKVLTMGLHIDSDEDYVSIDWVLRGEKYYKPVLRPLSDIPDELDSIHMWRHNDYLHYPGAIDGLPYGLYNEFIKLHFDVFGLIPAGLAIDINTISPHATNRL